LQTKQKNISRKYSEDFARSVLFDRQGPMLWIDDENVDAFDTKTIAFEE